MNSGAGLGAEIGARLLVLGDYWHPDRDERTEIGLLIHRAKDLAEEVAAQELAERFASLASHLAETARRLRASGGAGSVEAGASRRRRSAASRRVSRGVLGCGRRGGVPAEPRGEDQRHAAVAPHGSATAG